MYIYPVTRLLDCPSCETCIHSRNYYHSADVYETNCFNPEVRSKMEELMSQINPKKRLVQLPTVCGKWERASLVELWKRYGPGLTFYEWAYSSGATEEEIKAVFDYYREHPEERPPYFGEEPDVIKVADRFIRTRVPLHTVEVDEDEFFDEVIEDPDDVY